MENPNQTPLDYEEVIEEKKEVTTPRQRLLLNLEFIPLIILAIGLFMRYRGMGYATEVLTAGGMLCSFLYLFFSWYMFKVGKYLPLEVILSILCGMIVPVGILGMLFRLESWEGEETLLSYALYGGVGLTFVSIVLFIFHLRDKRASEFYRNLIARLLIFTVLLLQFNAF